MQLSVILPQNVSQGGPGNAQESCKRDNRIITLLPAGTAGCGKKDREEPVDPVFLAASNYIAEDVSLSLDVYARTGCLEDLRPWIDGDPDRLDSG